MYTSIFNNNSTYIFDIFFSWNESITIGWTLNGQTTGFFFKEQERKYLGMYVLISNYSA